MDELQWMNCNMASELPLLLSVGMGNDGMDSEAHPATVLQPDVYLAG